MLSPTARPTLTALLACLAFAVAPAGASAAAGAGTVTLGVGGGGKAAKALTAAGVRTSAIAPAKKRSGGRIVLPVRGIAVATSAKATLRGGIAFRAGRRAAKLKSVRLVVTTRRATVSAKVGKTRKAFFTASLPVAKTKLDRAKTTATVAGGKLALTKAGAKLLRAKLGVSGIVAGRLGSLAADARPITGAGGGGGGTPGGGAPGGGNPQSGPIENEPPVAVRPPTAVDASNIAITWYPRDSFIRYLSSAHGAQDGFFAGNGATKLPPTDTGSHPCSDAPYAGSGTFDYAYAFTPKSGWYDPPTQTAAIYGQGDVTFRWKERTIDLTASDPEIELNPASPRAIFRFNGTDGTAFPNQRAVLNNLDLTGQPTVAGDTRTYAAARGTLTADGSAVFAGFYAPGDGFGCVTVSFTHP